MVEIVLQLKFNDKRYSLMHELLEGESCSRDFLKALKILS